MQTGPVSRQRSGVTGFLDSAAYELRFAVRQVVRNPAFALLVVLTLAMGIGPNVAIFSVFRALVLEPLPYPDADRLVQVWTTERGNWQNNPFSPPDYFDIRERNTHFEEIGAYTTVMYNVAGDETELVQGITCTAGVLRSFAVEPALGQLFDEGAEREGADRVVVLGHGLWTRRFGSDPAIIGETVRVNGEEHAVLGIMPEGFEFYSPWFRGQRYELWTPIVLSRDEDKRNSHSYLALGRLRPGVGWREATAELQAIGEQLAAEYPATNTYKRFWAYPFSMQIFGGATERLLFLLGTVGFVLLVACANVAGMLLARGTSRRAEVAVRAALGSTRRRVVSQLLSESLVLSLLGGLAGVTLAWWSLDLLRGLVPAEMPRGAAIELDGWVLLAAVGLTLLTTLLFGLGPSLRLARTDLVAALKQSSPGAGTRSRALRGLTIAQLAIALLLTNGAILLYASYRNVLRVPQVFESSVLTAETWLTGPRYESDSQKAAFARRLVERLEGLPGIQRAAVANKLPLEGGTSDDILADDETFDPEVRRPFAERSLITPGYFEAMGIPLIAGRTIRDEDASGPEYGVVVNRALADQYWLDESPLGQRLRENSESPRWTAVVVGVVESVRQFGPERRPYPEIYFPFERSPWTKIQVIVRSHPDSGSLVSAARAELTDLDPDLALANVRTMGQVFRDATRERRFLTLLVNLFTGIALLLVLAGVYGSVSFEVAQRRHEIGIRVAMGAGRWKLLRMVLSRVLRDSAIGLIFGLIMTVNASFAVGGLVYGVGALSPLLLLLGVVCVVTVSLLASLVPALRATRFDPVETLRTV